MTTKGQRQEKHDDRAMEMILTGALATGVGVVAEIKLRESIDEIKKNETISPSVRKTLRWRREALDLAKEVTKGGKALAKTGISEFLKPKR